MLSVASIRADSSWACPCGRESLLLPLRARGNLNQSFMTMALRGRSRSELAEPRGEISGQIGAKSKIVLVLLVQMTANLGFC